MSTNKRNKKYGKIIKKSIWPAILMFCVMVFVTVTLVVTFVSLFMYYMVSSKFENIKANGNSIAMDIQRVYQANGEVYLTNQEMKKHLNANEEVCFADDKGKIIAKTGENLPDIDNCITLDLNQRFEIYKDKGNNTISNEEELMSQVYEVLINAFQNDIGSNPDDNNVNNEMPETDGNPVFMYGVEDSGATGNWMKDNMLNVGFWIKVRIPEYNGSVYIRDVFSIERQDVFYASAVALLAIIFLLVPMTVLFVNMIMGIVNQRRMMRLLYKDPVTEDNNWLYFKAAGIKNINMIKNKNRSYAIVNLHINKYMDYCSFYGVEAGERIVKSINGYLNIKTDVGEIYARHSGGDFALLLKYKDSVSFSMRIRTMIAELMGLEAEQDITFSTGVFIIPAGDADDKMYQDFDRKNIDIDQLYNCACEAAVKNKKSGSGIIGFFSEEMLEDERWERKVEKTMEQALLNHEFVAYYQPKYNPADNRLVSAEALVRWFSPAEGIIPPDKFIPIFEKNGFIRKLDDYMIREIAKQQAEWKIAGKKIVPVSVNISREHFVKDQLAKEICYIVDSYGADRKMIEFEITESAFLDDKKVVIEVVKKLRNAGFTISIDDFGTGYSSLNSLKELPCDVLKLDAEFFRLTDEKDEERSKTIVTGVINLAKTMNMKVVAEGVETKELCEFLASKGCDMIQGYYFSKPLSAEEFLLKVEEDS
ncbi:MAG: EAL domain-containing protein [Lachnospira sp.]